MFKRNKEKGLPKLLKVEFRSMIVKYLVGSQIPELKTQLKNQVTDSDIIKTS